MYRSCKMQILNFTEIYPTNSAAGLADRISLVSESEWLNATTY